MADYENELMIIQQSLMMQAYQLAKHKKYDMCYVYVSLEGEDKAYDAFFTYQNELYTAKELNPKKYEKMKQKGLKEMDKLYRLSNQYDRQAPTEMRITLNKETRDLSAKVRYDYVLHKKKTTAEVVFNKWMEQVQKKLK